MSLLAVALSVPTGTAIKDHETGYGLARSGRYTFPCEAPLLRLEVGGGEPTSRGSGAGRHSKIESNV